jgi:hypothetical protein
LITETLGPGHLTFPAGSFQTQLLKVVFTTLYVDVKEPAVCDISGDKKNSTLSSDSNHVSVIKGGTKLSINLQSQNIEEPTPAAFAVGSPASGGISKLDESANPSTHNPQLFSKNFANRSPPTFA